MLDEDWLSNLRFTAIENIQVDGLACIGSEFLALSGFMPDGKKIAIRTPKTSIAFHIKEVHPHLSLRPEYDLDRVNEKLHALVGSKRFDRMSTDYNSLYCKIMYIISKSGIPGLLFSNLSQESVETIPFIIHTPPLLRRLKEFAEWPFDPGDPLTMLPTVNGEKYKIRLIITQDRRDAWIEEAIEGLNRLPEWNKELDSKSVFDNPLIIWGAAAMDGFFTNEELPNVAKYLSGKYGSFVDRPDVMTIMGQADAMASLISQYLDRNVEAFVSLCAHCGLLFQVRNMKGDVVADGTKILIGK